MKAEDFAREAERAHIELRMQAAILGRHHRLQESGLAQRLHARAAGFVDIVMRQACARSRRAQRDSCSAKPR